MWVNWYSNKISASKILAKIYWTLSLCWNRKSYCSHLLRQNQSSESCSCSSVLRACPQFILTAHHSVSSAFVRLHLCIHSLIDYSNCIYSRVKGWIQIVSIKSAKSKKSETEKNIEIRHLYTWQGRNSTFQSE